MGDGGWNQFKVITVVCATSEKKISVKLALMITAKLRPALPSEIEQLHPSPGLPEVI